MIAGEIFLRDGRDGCNRMMKKLQYARVSCVACVAWRAAGLGDGDDAGGFAVSSWRNNLQFVRPATYTRENRANPVHPGHMQVDAGCKAFPLCLKPSSADLWVPARCGVPCFAWICTISSHSLANHEHFCLFTRMPNEILALHG